MAQLPWPYPQVLSWAQQQGERLQAQTASLAAEREEMAQLIDWITAAEEALSLRDQEPLPEEAEQLEELNAQHTVRDPPPSSPPRLKPTEDFWMHQAEAVGAACACSNDAAASFMHGSSHSPSPLGLWQGLLMQEGRGEWGGSRAGPWVATLPASAPCPSCAGALWQVFMEELNRKQPDVEKVTKSCKRKLAAELGPPAARRLATRKTPPLPPVPHGAVPQDRWLCPHRPSPPAAGRRSTGKAQGAPVVPLGGLEPQTPLMAQLLHRWQQLWLLALDRQYRLETALQRLREVGAALVVPRPRWVPAAGLVFCWPDPWPWVRCGWGRSLGLVGWSRQHPGAFPNPVPVARSPCSSLQAGVGAPAMAKSRLLQPVAPLCNPDLGVLGRDPFASLSGVGAGSWLAARQQG